MAYCTQTQYEAQFGATELEQLTDRANEGAINATAFSQAAEQATDTVDFYCRAAYTAVGVTVPLTSPPDIVVGWALDITRWRLFGDIIPEAVQARYDDIIRMLTAIMRGQATPPMPTGTTEATVAVQWDADTRVWDRAADWR